MSVRLINRFLRRCYQMHVLIQYKYRAEKVRLKLSKIISPGWFCSLVLDFGRRASQRRLSE
uniref:Uncharacterized protein n=1 Tax=Anguilla anguilla TaxID=7936 RepID=A0A0E9QZ12_ANGAN